MEVKFYLTDNTKSSLSLSSDVIKSHVNSTSSIIIDPDYLEFEFEMVALGYTNTDDFYDGRYTSLKDISPPPELLSRKESWREVPLKDPLVQQAVWAWAYLPLSKAEHQQSSFMRKLKDGFVGCFKNVILAITGKHENYDIDDQETCENVDW